MQTDRANPAENNDSESNSDLSSILDTRSEPELDDNCAGDSDQTATWVKDQQGMTTRMNAGSKFIIFD